LLVYLFYQNCAPAPDQFDSFFYQYVATLWLKTIHDYFRFPITSFYALRSTLFQTTNMSPLCG